MSSFRLRRFSKPEVLRQVSSTNLLKLLGRFRDYFTNRQFQLPDEALVDGAIDYDALASILSDPAPQTPRGLSEALYFIDDMATAAYGEQLLNDLCTKWPDVVIPDRASNADVALVMWLTDAEWLQRRHAERVITKRRSFLHFRSQSPAALVIDPADEQAYEPLRAQLSVWFREKKHGDVTRIFVSTSGDFIWCLIRYGGMHQRVGCIEDGQSRNLVYQPEVYDVVGFNLRSHELRTNTGLKGASDLYRAKFAEHLVGRPDHFGEDVRYTLEPLRSARDLSLVCTDIEGLESVTLTELHLYWGGTNRYTEIIKANDVFAVLRDRGRPIPKHVPMTSATFRVKFADSKSERSVCMRPPNFVKFTRDEDGILVDEWLHARGFKKILRKVAEPVRFWSAVRNSGGRAHATIEWKGSLGPEFDAARRYLQPDGTIASGYFLEDGRQRRVVDHGDGTYESVDDDAPLLSGAIGKHDVISLAINHDRLCADVASAFSLCGEPRRMEAGSRVIYLGEHAPYAGVSRSVYFVSESETSAVLSAVNQVLLQDDEPCIVCVASESMLHELRSALTEVEWFGLDTTLAMDAEGAYELTPAAMRRMDGISQAMIPAARPGSGMVFFPTPTGAQWKDVSIKFVDAHNVLVRAKEASGRYGYAQMGMRDSRDGDPDKQWDLLKRLADGRGRLTWQDGKAKQGDRQQKGRLQGSLSEFFRIEGSPFHPYDKEWRVKFSIESDR